MSSDPQSIKPPLADNFQSICSDDLSSYNNGGLRRKTVEKAKCGRRNAQRVAIHRPIISGFKQPKTLHRNGQYIRYYAILGNMTFFSIRLRTAKVLNKLASECPEQLTKLNGHEPARQAKRR
jgi:hypothetical protein